MLDEMAGCEVEVLACCWFSAEAREVMSRSGIPPSAFADADVRELMGRVLHDRDCRDVLCRRMDVCRRLDDFGGMWEGVFTKHVGSAAHLLRVELTRWARAWVPEHLAWVARRIAEGDEDGREWAERIVNSKWQIANQDAGARGRWAGS